MLYDLTGKVALVTGATGGIGQSIARHLQERGATLVISGTREAALKDLAADMGGKTLGLPCRLDDAKSLATLVEETEKQMGSLDILVNNAGITRDTLALRMKDEDWHAVMDVNLSAAFKVSRSALRGMMKRRWGRIINITSIVGVTGNAGQVNYAASKAGMIGMSKSLAQEVATRGITVNCVAPGFIETPMTDVLPQAQKEKLLTSIPTARLGSPQDVASACVYLASPEAGYITGQTLHVNGGMAMI